MKIVHTSDWHLGHTLYGYERIEEHTEMIRQLEKILQEEKPDALVVSGDVYHTAQPSAAAQTFFTESIMKLRAAVPGMTIVIIAGNHDSASKHEISRVLWATQNVHMLGTVDKDNWDNLIIPVEGKGWIIGIPYQNERSIPEGFYQTVLDKTKEKNSDNLPVVMAAHLTVSGSDFTGHEDARDVTVGGIDGVSIDELGEGYDYLALGHIHRPQTIQGTKACARYSGTPVAVSFDEAYPHSVSVVEIASHGEKPLIREQEIKNPRPLVTLPTSGFEDWDSVVERLKVFPKDKPVYVRLNVQVDDYLPQGAEQQARELVKGTPVTITHINARRKATESAETKSVTVDEFKMMEPLEVAKLYAEKTGRVFDKEMEELFREAADAVLENNRLA